MARTAKKKLPIYDEGVLLVEDADSLDFQGAAVAGTISSAANVVETVTGDVVGPASSTDNAIARFDGATGKLIQDYTSGAPTISDTGAVNIPLTTGNSLVVDTDVLVVDATNNRVGIRTASPLSTLSVVGQSRITPSGADSQNTLLIENLAGNPAIQLGTFIGASSYAGFWAGNVTPTNQNYTLIGNGTTETIFNTPTSGSILFRINQVSAPNAMRLNATGLSINTNSGASRLSVKGNAGIGATYSDIAAPTSGLIVEGNVGIGTSGPTTGLHINTGTGAVEQLRISNSGDASKYLSIGDDFINKEAQDASNTNLTIGTSFTGGATGGGIRIHTGVNVFSTVFDKSGNVGIGQTTPTAVLHIKAGTATASTAPLKLTSGTLNTTAEAGAVEFLTDAFYGTITTGAARKTFAFLESPVFTTNITTPLIVGGTAVGSNIIYKSTTGAGTAAGIAHQFIGGTDGATVAMTVLNNGNVGIGTASPTHALTLPVSSTGIAIYNTADQVTNFERGSLKWTSNLLSLITEKGGSGTARDIRLSANGDTDFIISAGGGGVRFFDFAKNSGNSSAAWVRITGTLTQSSGLNELLEISNTINQSGTAGYTGLLINPTETSTGSGVKRLISAQTGGVDRFVVTNTGAVIIAAGTATASTAPLKFKSGTLNTTAEAGAVEFLTDAFYGTITTGAARRTFAFLEAPVFTTSIQTPTIELGHATDTTIARVSAGIISVEGNNVLTANTGLPLAGGTMTGNITLGENASIALDPAGSADGKYTGITVTGTAGATLAFGDLIYLAVATSKWVLTDADAAATAGGVMIGMCVLAANDTQSTTILLQGIIRADAKFPALTIGAAVYVGETAGAIQVSIPTGADNIIRVVGFALTNDEIYFNPSQDFQTIVA